MIPSPARSVRTLLALCLAGLVSALATDGCTKGKRLPLRNPLVLVYQKPVDLRRLGSDYPPGFILGGGGIYSTFSSFTSAWPEVFQPADSYLVRLDPDGSVHPLTPEIGAGVRDPEVSWDGQRIVFSMKAGVTGRWQVHEVKADGTELRRISQDDRYNDFDPAYVPDGDIVFLSDRPGLLDPIFHKPSAQLHTMHSDGTEVKQLSVDPGGEFDPTITADGHLLFTQWNSHYKNFDWKRTDVQPGIFLALDRFLIWKIAMDGTSNAHPFFGDHLIEDFTGGLLYPREIPDGSGKLVAALVDARGTYGSGALVRLDPSKNADQQSLEFLTPNVHLNLEPDVPGRWRSPYPLADGDLVAVYGEGPLVEATFIPPAGPPGIAEGVDGQPRSVPIRPVQAPPPRFKLMLLRHEGTGQPEVLLERPDVWMFSPVELAPRTRPAVARGTAKPELGYGVINSFDVQLRDRNADEVRNGDRQMVPAAGEVAKVQIFKGEFVPADGPGIDPRFRKVEERFLGEVPVEQDGSFAAVVPANVPLFWRTVRADGSPLVEDPFFTQVHPGQVITCNGCHSPHNGKPGRQTNLARNHPVNVTGLEVDTNHNGVVDLLE
jgi:hydrazine synthase alpha subunit-like protein/WD40 repeat protein